MAAKAGQSVFNAAVSCFSASAAKGEKCDDCLEATFYKPGGRQRFFRLADERIEYWMTEEDARWFEPRGSYDVRDLDEVSGVTGASGVGELVLKFTRAQRSRWLTMPWAGRTELTLQGSEAQVIAWEHAVRQAAGQAWRE